MNRFDEIMKKMKRLAATEKEDGLFFDGKSTLAPERGRKGLRLPYSSDPDPAEEKWIETVRRA